MEIKCPKCGSTSTKPIENSKGQLTWKLKSPRGKHELTVGMRLCHGCGHVFRHAEKT